MAGKHEITRTAIILPVLALLALVLAWGRQLPLVATALIVLLLGGAILAAVHHAELVAARVGEPYGALILAVAVTVIEVGLIVILMVTNAGKSASLARDTVFAAIMICLNGILGASLLVATTRRRLAAFNPEGSGAILACVVTLATLTLVLPTFTTSARGPVFAPAQLVFAAVASLVVYGLFVATQTVRHREQFLPVDPDGRPLPEADRDRPRRRTAAISMVLLALALVAIVGDAKIISPALERAVSRAGLPPGVVGVVIALLVLMPEAIAAITAARRGRVQIAINLALGSAIASIGLTVPAIALAKIWLPGPLMLGLGPTQIVELALTAVICVLTIVPGRATLLQAGLHLSLMAAFLVLAVAP